MTKFEKVKEPMVADFYSIDMNDDGEKQIHYFGCIEHDEDWWRLVEVCFFIEPLAEFIENLSKNVDYVYEKCSELKQYIRDISEEEAVNIINSYFNGSPADYILAISDLTTDTPCGNYIY